MDINKLQKELKFRTSRSSGSGGQHVNKVSTKVELIFDLTHSEILTAEEKSLLKAALKNRLTKDGLLIISSQASRSQVRNRKKALEKFEWLIAEGLIPEKERKEVTPLQSDRKKRLKIKRQHAEKKSARKKVILYEGIEQSGD